MEEHDPRESLKQSLIEMKQISEGKLPRKTWDELYEELKDDELVQYFVVNSELNMSSGKIAAQVAHVSTNITHDVSTSLTYYLDRELLTADFTIEVLDSWRKWFENNQPKIILRGKQKEMEKLIEQGWYYIRDNGRTEIPEGSLTVVGCVPEYRSVMKTIVKRFQLL
jgi:PTH2 family peptidyl-tRNA hydrolase